MAVPSPCADAGVVAITSPASAATPEPAPANMTDRRLDVIKILLRWSSPLRRPYAIRALRSLSALVSDQNCWFRREPHRAVRIGVAMDKRVDTSPRDGLSGSYPLARMPRPGGSRALWAGVRIGAGMTGTVALVADRDSQNNAVIPAVLVVWGILAVVTLGAALVRTRWAPPQPATARPTATCGGSQTADSCSRERPFPADRSPLMARAASSCWSCPLWTASSRCWPTRRAQPGTTGPPTSPKLAELVHLATQGAVALASGTDPNGESAGLASGPY